MSERVCIVDVWMSELLCIVEVWMSELVSHGTRRLRGHLESRNCFDILDQLNRILLRLTWNNIEACRDAEGRLLDGPPDAG